MTHSTISAEPERLYHYATRSQELDEALICRAGELEGRLSHFEQRCKEPGFQVVASPSAAPVRDHGRESQALAERVRQVGRRFAQADALRIGRRSRQRWLNNLRRGLRFIDMLPLVPHPLVFVPIVVPPAWLILRILDLTWVQEPLESPGPDDVPGDDVPGPSKRSEPGTEQKRSEADDDATVDVSGPTADQETESDETSEHISQHSPSGDDDILNLKRKETEEKYEKVDGKKLITVKDQIARFGCLMTCYTMLLNDLDVDVQVTDLYKQKYKREHPDADFDQDAEDGTIVLFDLDTPPDVAENAADAAGKDNISVEEPTLEGSTDDKKEKSLKEEIDEHGSVILHVTGEGTDREHGHWIVVDGYTDEGFSIRDPMADEEATGVTFKKEDTYQIHSDGEYKVVEETAEEVSV
jgi:hypothetical protein